MTSSDQQDLHPGCNKDRSNCSLPEHNELLSANDLHKLADGDEANKGLNMG